MESQQRARDARVALVEKCKTEIASLQFESMVVISKIVGGWEQGDLKPSEALIKIGLAKAKHKRLFSKILEGGE
jgi:hypothetical protein